MENKEKNTAKDMMKDTAKSIRKRILDELGIFFANARDEKNFSVRKLSDLSGVSSAVISDLETCKSMPRFETIIQLALALDITDMNKVFSNFIKDDSQVQTHLPFKQIRLTLAELEFSNGEINQIIQYIRYITYLREKRLERERNTKNVQKTNDK